MKWFLVITLLLAALLVLARPLAAQDPSLVLKDGGIEFPDGTVQNTAAGAYHHVLVVAPSGGDFTSVQAALDSVTGSPDHRYLVWLAPGSYHEQITMESYVDIRGAGRALTTIAAHAGQVGCSEGTVAGADDAELRSLTVRSTAYEENCAVALYNSGASPVLTDVKLDAESGVFNVAMVNELGSAPRLHHVIVESCGDLFEQGPDCIGIWNNTGSAPSVRESEINVFAWDRAWGVRNEGGSVLTLRDSVVRVGADTQRRALSLEESSVAYVYDSRLVSIEDAIYNDGTATCKIAHSELQGAVAAGCDCVGAFDASFTALDDACQPIP